MLGYLQSESGKRHTTPFAWVQRVTDEAARTLSTERRVAYKHLQAGNRARADAIRERGWHDRARCCTGIVPPKRDYHRTTQEHTLNVIRNVLRHTDPALYETGEVLEHFASARYDRVGEWLHRYLAERFDPAVLDAFYTIAATTLSYTQGE